MCVDFVFLKNFFFCKSPSSKKKTNNNKQINRLVSPCDGCEAPYGYRNHMPLSTDTAEFSVRQQLQFSQSLSLSHQYHRSFSILLQMFRLNVVVVVLLAHILYCCLWQLGILFLAGSICKCSPHVSSVFAYSSPVSLVFSQKQQNC